MFVVGLMFLYSIFFIILYSTHYMVFLLLLELLLFSIFVYLCIFGIGGFLVLFLFLLVMVCMGGYSVSLLVNSTRYVGRDFFIKYYIF